MFRGYVLRYLAAVAESGDPAVGDRAVPALVRPFAQRGARKHVLAAGFETERADDEGHVHRLAYLHAVKAPTADANDVEAVRRHFVQGRRSALEAKAPVGLGCGLLLLATVAGLLVFGAWYATRAPQPAETTGASRERPSLEELMGFEDAEEAHPLRDLFRHGLPDYVVALDRRSAGRERAEPDDVASRRAAVLASLRGAGPEGEALAPAMEGLLDAAQGFVDREPDLDEGEWLNRLVRFHDALDAQRVPFFVDATLLVGRGGRRRLLLSTWRVEGRRELQSGEHTIRALEISRLDTLNFERALLGYTRPESRYAMVVRDRIERFLVEEVLPSVHAPEDSVIVRGYEDETGIDWVTDFEGWAHEDLRREAAALVRAALDDEEPLDGLAAAVVRRRNAVAGLSSASRVRLRAPRSFDYDVERAARYGDAAAGPALAELRRAEQALHAEAHERAYEVLRDAHATSVTEHEAQHRLDYESDRLVTVPAALVEYTGDTEELDRVNRRAERANAELSAYLAQIARRPAMAFTSLVHVAGFLMSRPSWGMPESYAAAVLIEALADEAGVAHAPLIARRRVDRAEAARIYGELRQRDARALSALAAASWQRLYGTPLPPLSAPG